MSLRTIREVTELIGVTENALRYYNARGILLPSMQEKSGRRQWLYDDEAVWCLKKIMLLKYMGVPMKKAKEAIKDDEIYRRIIMKTLAEMKKEREKLDQRIFVAEVLEISSGIDLIQPDDNLDEREAAALNEVIREYLKKMVK